MIRILESLKAIKEMAERIDIIKSRLYDKHEQIRENLMQIFLWRNTTTVNHWCNELYGLLNEVPKCKHSHKYPKYSIILQEIWLCWEDCYDDRLDKYIKLLERKESNVAPNFSKSNLYLFLKDYCEWISKYLANKGTINDDELVKTKIKELLNKYPIE